MIRSTDHGQMLGQHAHQFILQKRTTRLALCFVSGTAAAVAPPVGAQAGSALISPALVGSSPASYSVALLEPIVVVGSTPLVGIGLPLAQVAANVQLVRAGQLDAQHRLTLTEYVEKNLPSIDVNDVQGNPYQANVNYRGFTASPLLGTPEGLSVFVDGVRINEPFGDVVNWDLLPQAAIDSIEIVPGSNPTYGLNTLGGAIAISTKNGKRNVGGDIEATGGSWGRKTFAIEQGGSIGPHLDYYATGNVANDGGWADHNASRVRQAFGKLRYHDADTTVTLSAGGADNDLQGTQTIPRSLLDDFRQPYTYPDRNRNSAGYVTLSGEHAFDDSTEFAANIHVRRFVSRNTSSNVNTDYGAADSSGAIDTLEGSNVESMVGTNSYGASAQMTRLGKLGAMPNQFVVGATGDVANSHYTESSQEAAFTASRAALGIGDFVQQVNARTRDATLAIYLQDTLSLTQHWSMTLSARYNWAKAKIGDASGVQPKLDASHVFSRLNSAVGLAWNPSPALTAYATYNEGMRTPTAIELACADPSAPCSLPNDFVSDPALAPVISKTVEVGARGKIGHGSTWSAALYRTTLLDDIAFISAPGASQGFFHNVGNTRRQGVELAGHTQVGKLGVTANYSYVDATYRSSWLARSPSNSNADANGNITVRAGNHLPGIAAHTLKVRLDYAATPKWTLGTNLTYRSSLYAQGDENNADARGKISGYYLIDFDTHYQVTRRLAIFATVTNVLNKRYASYGALGRNFFNGPQHTFAGSTPITEQFIGPGAPRGAWLGVRYAWD